jgi:Zn-dependent protease
VWGIPIGLNASWFLIFALVVFSLSSSYFPNEYPQLSTAAYVILAAVTAIGLFGSVLLHELGHSLLALRNNIPVKSINLFIFGGVAQISREPESPGVEFRIAIAGPLVSLGLAVLFGGLWMIDREIPYLAAPSLYLARLNLTLALFNMIPGFPLDGGRVLRSIIWKLTGSQVKATRVASLGGKLVAYGFFGLGVFMIFSGGVFNGLWLIFIGWFLQNAANQASQAAVAQHILRGVTVAQAMEPNPSRMPALSTLQQIVDERVLSRGESAFFIVDFDGRLLGLLTLQDIAAQPKSVWRYTTGAQVMTPLNRLIQVDANAELLTALRNMDEAEAHHAAVVEQNRAVGVISREQVLRYLQMRANLGM